ncbi:hypothetical protein BT96DRAFT_999005 [Gymnopus androsaceus JB14]|uniref:Uncharacterized protein n=1 Tax=Gymnopus androsaceus JB14 TaxID=1447944 RepID=A0A6A4H9A7_9AGAR|nr:hypothetical protein BT96DRAFT_999005 [Gymnopus androsaceus JB14]
MSQMTTRGKRVILDPSLLPRTLKERKTARDEKASKAQAAKDAAESEQKGKALHATHDIARVEDERSLEKVKRQSLRPDLDLKKKLPLSAPKAPKPPPEQRKSTGLTMSPEPEPLPPPPQRAPKGPKPKQILTLIAQGYDQESAILKAPEAEGSTEDGAANEIAAPEDLDLLGIEEEDDLMDFTSVPDLHGGADTSESDYISVMGMDVDAEDDQSSEAAFETPAVESDGSSYRNVASDSESDSDYEAAFEEWKRSRRAGKALKTKNKKKRATAETKKIQKTAVRAAVAAARTEKPPTTTNVVPAVANSKKRASASTETNIVNKRAKGPDLGGLCADFKIALKKAGAPTLANTSNDPLIARLERAQQDRHARGEYSDADHMGKFDHEETAESVNTAREAKQTGAKASTIASQKLVETQVRLVPANVNVIDAKERHGKHLTFNKTNLPISTTADHRKWDVEFMPTILDFSDCKDDPAIAGFCHTQIRTYRSELGKKALKIIGRKIDELEDDLEERAAYIAAQLEEDYWAYSNPGFSVHSTGTLRGPGILETFAQHCELARSFKVKSPYGFPAGALALSAAAYLRALRAFEPGYNSIDEARKTQQAERKKEGKGRVSNNNKDGFREDPWAEHVGSYYNLVKSVNDSKWMTIFEATEQFINVRKFEKRQPVSDPVADARMVEQEDKLVMSE